jgi:hypothetical protein
MYTLSMMGDFCRPHQPKRTLGKDNASSTVEQKFIFPQVDHHLGPNIALCIMPRTGMWMAQVLSADVQN